MCDSSKQCSSRPLFLTSLLACILFPAFSFAEEAVDLGPSRLILGATAYYESGRLEGEEQVATQERDQSFDYRGANFLSTRIIYLRPFSERLLIGGGIDFMGSYQAMLLEEDGPADPPDLYEFGPKVDFFVVGEWRIDLTGDVDLGVGAQAGLVSLFPRGDLAEEIRDLQDSNVPVFSGPRPGWSAGAHVAGIYRIDDRISLRGDLGAQWESIFVFRTSRTVDGVAFRKNWTTGTLRTRLGVSMEVSF